MQTVIPLPDNGAYGSRRRVITRPQAALFRGWASYPTCWLAETRQEVPSSIPNTRPTSTMC